jgi:hypothetical protein
VLIVKLLFWTPQGDQTGAGGGSLLSHLMVSLLIGPDTEQFAGYGSMVSYMDNYIYAHA